MAVSVPRGRYAPPVSERRARDRLRLADAALLLIEAGHQQLTAEQIVREAKMSKATFYELWGGVADFMPYLLARIRMEAFADGSAAGRVRWAAATAGVALSHRSAAAMAIVLDVDRQPALEAVA